MTDAYLPEIECAPAERWRAYQDELVRTVVNRAYEKTLELRDRLDRAGVAIGELKSVADIARIPVLSKDALPDLQAAAPPFGGLLAGDIRALKRVFVSPGPILDPQGTAPDYWGWAPALWACGFRRGDCVYNTFSYHLTPAGAMMEEGLAVLGCTVVPGGVGNTDAQVELLSLSSSTGFCGTPQFLWTLLERAREKGADVSLERGFVSGAPLPTTLRDDLSREFGITVLQGYGTADVGAIAYECEANNGWHIAPGRVIEVLAETGEVVVTVDSDTYPLVRFGTGDISSLEHEPCACGRTTPRLMGFQGRVGEGVKVRGMFVHPRQIVRALATVYDETPRFQAVVSGDGRDDAIIVRVEAEGDPLGILERLRAELKLRVDVELVPEGTLASDLPRSATSERGINGTEAQRTRCKRRLARRPPTAPVASRCRERPRLRW